MDGRSISREQALAIADKELGPSAREQALEAEIERLKEELEVQHARTADQFDRAEKAEAIMDAAREGES